MRLIPVVLPVVLSCLLAACGGGGGGSDANDTPAPPPVLQIQTIAFSQTGALNWKLTNGPFTNVASGGAGSGAITYQSSNPAVASVNANTGVVTPIEVGTAQITATKAADAIYQSATASYTLSVMAPVSVPFTAAIGAQDAQVSFAPSAQGLEFLRTTQMDCNAAQFTACTDNRIDTLSAVTLTDATTRLSTDAIWWLRDGAGIGAPTRISQRRFKARARMTLASFQGKLLAIGGQNTDVSRVSVLMLVKLARIFDTSVEELSGLRMPIRPKRRLSPAGVRHAESYQKLSKTEQRFVKRIIDTVLERVAAQPSVAST